MTSHTAQHNNAAIAAASGNTSKFLVFNLGKEEYAVPILRVREIIGLLDITPLPQMPDFVKGVINLRGRIIPVIELRGKIGLSATEYTETTCIVILEVADTPGGEMYPMGAIVDAVREVLDIADDQIQPPPKFSAGVSSECIHGMGKVKDHVIALLDVDHVMTGAETAALLASAAA
ncbi:MAG: purine-binding chemotaxis protein CheW [Phycisphaerales bacterium]|nr:purine-binding chemotaxis protein CheW [Phycisphaerales bacterium]